MKHKRVIIITVISVILLTLALLTGKVVNNNYKIFISTSMITRGTNAPVITAKYLCIRNKTTGGTYYNRIPFIGEHEK